MSSPMLIGFGAAPTENKMENMTEMKAKAHIGTRLAM